MTLLVLRLLRLFWYFSVMTLLVAGAVVFSGISRSPRLPARLPARLPVPLLVPLLVPGADSTRPPAGTLDAPSATKTPRSTASEKPAPQPAEVSDQKPAETVSDQPARSHRVARGETLWRLSQTYSVTISAIKQANGLETDVLTEGQLLVIPQTSGVHIVQEGETLWQISRRYQVALEEIARLNQLLNPGELQVGQEILIPKGANLAAAESESSPDETSPGEVSSGQSSSGQSSSGQSSSGQSSSGQFQTAPGEPGLIWPVQGVITSSFGPRQGRQHSGLDIAAPKGTPIKAAKAGKVVTVGWLGGYGQTVILEHPDRTMTLYAHASKLLVRKGEKVKQGQTIARVGSTGRSTGPHVHFEVIVNSKPRDPIGYLPKLRTAAKQR